MNNIEAIAQRINETIYVNEQPFLRQDTHSPHIVYASLEELRHIRYETLQQFYALMTALADGYRLVGNMTKALYYINHKLTASAPHTETHTEALLQQAAIYEHAEHYEEAYAILLKAQRHIVQYDHVECKTTLWTQLARCCLALQRYEEANCYVHALRHKQTVQREVS